MATSSAAPSETRIKLGDAHGKPTDARALLDGLAAAAAATADVDARSGRPPAAADVYGQGATLQAFEQEVADVIGKDAGVFVVSGVMAQLAALRVHQARLAAADGAAHDTVVLHATSHLLLHEEDAYVELMGLKVVVAGEAHRPLTAADVQVACGGVAAGQLCGVVVEVGHRHLGGAAPSLAQLADIRAVCDAVGVPLHCDGARLWDAQPAYGVPFADVAAHFHTVYLSFYKGLGALAGAMLVGDADVVAAARPWVRRMGGNLYTVLPFSESARHAFHTVLPTFGRRLDVLRAVVAGVASALADTPPASCVMFTPSPPQASLVHVYFAAPPEEVKACVATVAAATGIEVLARVRVPAAPVGVPPTVAAAADAAAAAGHASCSYTEWTMGVANVEVAVDRQVAAWVALAHALHATAGSAPRPTCGAEPSAE